MNSKKLMSSVPVHKKVATTVNLAVVEKFLRDIPNRFRSNEMVVNPNKFQVMFLGCGKNPQSLNVDGNTILSTDTVWCYY